MTTAVQEKAARRVSGVSGSTGRFRVPSSTGAGEYAVTLGEAHDDCPCVGFGYRFTCAHVKEAKRLIAAERCDGAVVPFRPRRPGSVPEWAVWGDALLTA